MDLHLCGSAYFSNYWRNITLNLGTSFMDNFQRYFRQRNRLNIFLKHSAFPQSLTDAFYIKKIIRSFFISKVKSVFCLNWYNKFDSQQISLKCKISKYRPTVVNILSFFLFRSFQTKPLRQIPVTTLVTRRVP